MQHLLFYDSVSEDFENVEENLATDLSAISITMVKNVHDNSLEMTLELYGQGGLESAPVLSELIYDPEVYLGSHFDQSNICPRCLMGLFDSKLINIFIQKGLSIHWNPDWQTAVLIDPAQLHFTTKLQAEDQ
jgi:hypothetical protein